MVSFIHTDEAPIHSRAWEKKVLVMVNFYFLTFVEHFKMLKRVSYVSRKF